MSAATDTFGDAKFVVLVPQPLVRGDDDARLAVLVPPIELMVQERLALFAVPISDAGLIPRLAEIFADRAAFGVHGVVEPIALGQAADAGAAFALASTADAELIEVGADRGLAVLPSALTPNEIQAAWRLNVSAVQVAPAEVMGGEYPARLKELLPGVSVIARGGLGGWSARRWLQAGAVACCLDDALVGDAFSEGELGDLRSRCRTFTDLLDEL